MSQPLDPSALPPLPEPFAPAPRPLRNPGCSRGALIGCGVLIALFGVTAVGLTLRADQLLVWILRRLETKVAAKLPPDLTAEERQRFSGSFEDLYKSLDDGKIDPMAVQGLQRELFTMSADVDRGLTRAQVLRLTAAVESAAGKSPPKPATMAPGGESAGPPAPAPARAAATPGAAPSTAPR